MKPHGIPTSPRWLGKSVAWSIHQAPAEVHTAFGDVGDGGFYSVAYSKARNEIAAVRWDHAWDFAKAMMDQQTTMNLEQGETQIYYLGASHDEARAQVEDIWLMYGSVGPKPSVHFYPEGAW